jgi:hypothetical protein
VIVTIMQPAYLPWLGYFHRVALSDRFIVLDHVQIDKSSKTGFAHRNKVRTKDGWCWLTVPLKTKGQHGQLYLNRLDIANDQPWAARHWATLRHCYSGSPFFAEHAPALERIYTRPWERLVDLCRELTGYQLGAFGIDTPVQYSSDMDVPGAKDELILNLCRGAGATTYISGPFGRDYLNAEQFARAGIHVIYHDYHHPTYSQVYPGFEPCMAALDLLCNCGPGSREILGQGNLDRSALVRGGLTQ